MVMQVVDVIDRRDFAVSEKSHDRDIRKILANERHVFAAFTVKAFAARATIEIKTQRGF